MKGPAACRAWPLCHGNRQGSRLTRLLPFVLRVQRAIEALRPEEALLGGLVLRQQRALLLAAAPQAPRRIARLQLAVAGHDEGDDGYAETEKRAAARFRTMKTRYEHLFFF